MKTYQKINTLYMRYGEGKNKGKIILGNFSCDEFEELYGCLWDATEKVDGTNMKLIYYPIKHTISVEGKTENAQNMCGSFDAVKSIGENILPKLQIEFPDDRFTEGDYVIIYGEAYGGKIREGGRYSEDVRFIAFDIKVADWYLTRSVARDICEKMGLQFVPYKGKMTLKEAEEMVMEGFVSEVSEDRTLLAEGLVLTPCCELRNRKGDRIIVKIKHKDYKQL